MQRPSYAVIGAGNRGSIYAGILRKNPDLGCVVAVADINPIRRQRLVDAHGLGPAQAFATWEELLAQPKLCDAIILATSDRMHMAPAERALRLGYDLLLEKPISPDPHECIRLANLAESLGRTVVVCHVLRYTPYYELLKRILDEGRIGQLVSVQWTENVAYWHQAHSFVRGNWRNSAESSPMLLQKCCHDMDMLQWLIGSRCLRVHSFGSLSHFRPECAPPGATDRCTDDCPAEPGCVYSAQKLYLGPNPLPLVSVVSADPSPAAVLDALRTGPYGRCVYRCDNDVVDHQTVNLEFAGGVTVAFTMAAFTVDCARSFKLMGTRGEIRGYDLKGELEIRTFDGHSEVVTATLRPDDRHLGGDFGLMQFMAERLSTGRGEDVGSVVASARSHLIVFAAEESRLTGRAVDLAEYESRLLGG